MKNGNIRIPIVAGQFYPVNPNDLKKEIENCFLSEWGPGFLPEKTKKEKIKGAICPHAGYSFSGPCAAHAYKKIAESKKPETYIILGLNHNGFSSCISLNNWKTPLGVIENDIEFGKLIEKKGIPVNEEIHQNEHSIEVQIPFIQFIDKNAKIMPIIAGDNLPSEKIAKIINSAAKELKRKIIIIASSDFTHYGPSYGYVPFTENIEKNMQNLDNGAIDTIKKMDSSAFKKYIEKTNATICGKNPIAVIIETLKSKKSKLLKYYTSGDILKDYTNAVGYAAIVFK